MATVNVGGKAAAATRRSTRQRKAPTAFEPSLNKKKAQGTDTKDKTEEGSGDSISVDKKLKTIKKETPTKKAPTTKKTPTTKKAPTTKKTPATKKAPATKKTSSTKKNTSKNKKPATKKNSSANEESTTPETSTIKRTASPEGERKTTKKARKVESFATPEEVKLLPEMRGRIERARREKMFVVSRNSVSDVHEEFEVTGSTGNLYTVTIGPRLACTCGDYRFRRRHCKHMLVVLLKMFRLTPSSPVFHTVRPDSNTLRQIFSACIPDPTSLIPSELKSLIDRKINGETDLPDIKTQRRPIDTSDCPICCNEFEENEIQDILFCRVCGNNIHAECFKAWKKTKGSSVTCVYCRSPWEDSVKPVNDLEVNPEGFINFSQELGLSGRRDTTTYRDFPGHN